MIAAEEREKMLAVHRCGRRVLLRLKSIWRPPKAIAALQNLIEAAARQGTTPAAR